MTIALRGRQDGIAIQYGKIANRFSGLRLERFAGRRPSLPTAICVKEMDPENSPLYVQSLASGIAVLSVFDAERRAMSLPEIAAAAGISKSAAQRFAFTLEAAGFLVKDPVSKRYALSSLNMDAGYRYLQSHPVLERANPYLLELHRAARETVNLAERAGLDMIYIARFPSLVRSIAHMPIGGRLPIFCSSTGRAYLSGLPEDQAYALLEASDRIRFTPQTVTDIDELMRLVAQAREQGFAYANNEYFRGDLALAVPIYDVAGHPVAAVNVSVAASEWTLKKATDRFVSTMQDTARLIFTTPPSPHSLAPFRLGNSAMPLSAADLPAQTPRRRATQAK